MSYILDALRKSDQQRRQGAAPNLTSAPIQAAEAARPNMLWFALLAIALLIAGIVIGWWRPWQSSLQPPAPPALVEQAPDIRARETRSVPVEPRRQVLPPVPLPAPALLVTAPVQAPPASAAVAKPVQIAAATPVPSAPLVAKPSPASAEPAQAMAKPKVLTRADLPPAIQQEIPKIVVALHAYSSKPGSRLVSVNDQLLHEGEALIPGLILEEITPDGMVFSYKGYRFHHGVQ